MVVIGITGRNCAGKDSLAHVLVEEGFERLSLSDVLRTELERRGRAITREALIAVGVELREAQGPAVLAERAKEMMTTDRVCLVSVRSPREVAALRTLPGFVLVAVDAPVEVRFVRERDRNRESAVTTLEEFVALEATENTSDEHAQQLDATLVLADEVLVNDGTPNDLKEKVLAFLRRIHA